MFNTVIQHIISFLTESGINAVMAFPETVIDKSKAVVCVSMRSAKITACGCGNYIGISLENGVVKEMLGSHGELKIGLNIYSPKPNCESLKENVFLSLGDMDTLTIKGFETGEVQYDAQSEMYRCECTVEASANLVRSLSAPNAAFALEVD